VHPHHHNVSLCTVVGVKIGSIVAVSPLERSLPVVAASAGTTNPLSISGPGTRVSPSIARSQVDAVDTMAAVEYLPTTLPPFTALEPGDLDGNLSDQDKYTACFPTNSSLTASSLSGTTEDAVGHSDHKTRLFRVALEMSPGDPIPAVKDPPLDSPCELLHVLTGASIAAEGEGGGTDENPRGRQSANECVLEYEQLNSRHGRSGVRVADIVKQFESMTVQFSCAKSSAPSSMTGSFAETELLYTRHRGSPFLARFKSGMVSASGIPSPLLSTASAAPLSPRLPSVSASATVGGKSSASDIQPQKLTFDPLCISGEPKVEFGGRMEEPTNINSIGCLGYNVLAPPPARVLAVGVRTLEHGGLKGVDEEFANSDGAGTLTVHPLECSCGKGLPRGRASPIEPSPVLFQACLHKCPAPSTVELGGLNATSLRGTVDSGRRSSEPDEQGVVSKGEEVRTLVCSERASSDTLAHTSRLASSLPSTSSFSPSPSILPLILSSFPPLVPSSVLACKIFVLVSAIIRMPRISYLGLPVVRAIAPCLAWEREGIGTCTWNNLPGAGARYTQLIQIFISFPYSVDLLELTWTFTRLKWHGSSTSWTARLRASRDTHIPQLRIS
jgi:hypothetical protein